MEIFSGSVGIRTTQLIFVAHFRGGMTIRKKKLLPASVSRERNLDVQRTVQFLLRTKIDQTRVRHATCIKHASEKRMISAYFKRQRRIDASWLLACWWLNPLFSWYRIAPISVYFVIIEGVDAAYSISLFTIIGLLNIPFHDPTQYPSSRSSDTIRKYALRS